MLYPIQYEEIVRRALLEDLGRAGDLTTDAIVQPAEKAQGVITSRATGRIAGQALAECSFQVLDPGMRYECLAPDGADVDPGAVVARLRGSARALLSAERTALNFLGRLSGIASAVRGMAQALQGCQTQIVCTRKTTPGLRALEKYAVRAGGGANHRFGLDDAVLIKDNHLLFAGGVAEAVRRVRSSVGHLVKIEVEIDTLEQLRQALDQPVDAVLLDNMDEPTLRQALEMARGKVLVEISGGWTPRNASRLVDLGADLISVGWLTHSAPSLDLSLEVKPLDSDPRRNVV